jgi:hypothetical protein
MDLQAIGKPISRHEERLSEKGTRGHTTFNVNYITYTQAHFTVLQQSVPVTPYVSSMSKCYDQVIRRSPKTGLQGNTETILVVGYVFKLWIRMQVFN